MLPAQHARLSVRPEGLPAKPSRTAMGTGVSQSGQPACPAGDTAGKHLHASPKRSKARHPAASAWPSAWRQPQRSGPEARCQRQGAMPASGGGGPCRGSCRSNNTEPVGSSWPSEPDSRPARSRDGVKRNRIVRGSLPKEGSTMDGMMNGAMMWGMGLVGVLVIIVLILAAAALIKYLFLSGGK